MGLRLFMTSNEFLKIVLNNPKILAQELLLFFERIFN